MGGHGGFLGGFMWIWWLIPIVLIVLVAMLATGGRGRPTGEAPPERRPDGDRAIEILRQRLARGEIDEAEYERLKRELES